MWGEEIHLLSKPVRSSALLLLELLPCFLEVTGSGQDMCVTSASPPRIGCVCVSHISGRQARTVIHLVNKCLEFGGQLARNRRLWAKTGHANFLLF